MFLYDLCKTFSSSSVTIMDNGERMWFGETHDLPSVYRDYYVLYADAIPRKRYRNNQTDLYAIVKKLENL